MTKGRCKYRASRILPSETESSREKGCRRDTFLGLCQEGRVKDIPAGAYTRSVLNRGYAVKAVEILATGSTLQPIELWASINLGKTHNGQMDVVLTLSGTKG